MERIVHKINLSYVWDVNGKDYLVMDGIVPDKTRNEPGIKKDIFCNMK